MESRKVMGKLTESMKGLKDAVKQQEIQLSKYIKINTGEDDEQIQSKHHGNVNEDTNVNGLPQVHLPVDMDHLLHSVG